MNEMLGNQYFMARNYIGAADVFQNVLRNEPNNLNAKKKLIISFTQIGKYSRALELFVDVIRENIDVITTTDPIRDDCPCPELVLNLENVIKNGSESFTTCQTLGILWLYCDIYKSSEYFHKALNLKSKDDTTNAIIVIIQKKINEMSAHNTSHYPS